MIQTVGLFLLAVLKFLGWTFLGLLLFLLAVLLLVLFVPVRYHVLAQNERSMEQNQKKPAAKLQLRLKATWLLHLLSVTVSYGPQGVSSRIRVAGIDIPGLLAGMRQKKEARQRRRSEKESRRTEKKAGRGPKGTAAVAAQELPAQEGEMPDDVCLHEANGQEQYDHQIEENEQVKENKQTEENEQVKENKQTEENEQVAKQEQSEKKECSAKQEQSEKSQQAQSAQAADCSQHMDSKRQAKTSQQADDAKASRQAKNKQKKQKRRRDRKQLSSKERGPGIFTKIRSRYEQLHKEFTDEANRHALGCIWTELLKILRSYKPRKLKADLAFSLADPALTGEAVGLLSLMPIVYRYACRIIPDFTSDQLFVVGEFGARGKVHVIVFLLTLLRLLLDKQFMQVVRRLMKRKGA